MEETKDKDIIRLAPYDLDTHIKLMNHRDEGHSFTVVKKMTLEEIMEEYGHFLTKEQVKKLKEYAKQ